ncbi:cyclin-dependent kinase 7 [Clupea harengus]|uniref:[RNA-polymerase]-subunit kinase n=1 Tax=Clupea harengus TaxID=7950 RepID=A0A8M1KR09_CLUHA|nr:cyclin-dependent kinase 7 [Clupea harengus]
MKREKSEYFKLRRTCHSKTDWVDIKFKGGVLQHPLQQDGDSCGVLVIMMANAVMEAFPKIPNIAFVFDIDNNCAMCSATKPPGPGPSFTDWSCLQLPFLAGDSDLDQLTKIFEALGTPTEETWPGMTNLPDYVSFKLFPGTPLEHIFSAAGDDLLELLQGLFTFNPSTRLTATQSLKMRYFSNRPGPTPGPQLPRPNCSTEALKEKENLVIGTKRKRDAISEGTVSKKLVF